VRRKVTFIPESREQAKLLVAVVATCPIPAVANLANAFKAFAVGRRTELILEASTAIELRHYLSVQVGQTAEEIRNLWLEIEARRVRLQEAGSQSESVEAVEVRKMHKRIQRAAANSVTLNEAFSTLCSQIGLLDESGSLH
jgi:hypothetical protein